MFNLKISRRRLLSSFKLASSAVIMALFSRVRATSAAEPVDQSDNFVGLVRKAQPGDPGVEELQRAFAEASARNLSALPFERVETTGADALATWERLRARGKGWPVIVGGDDDLTEIGKYFSEPMFSGNRRPAVDVLDAAAALQFPVGLREYRYAEDRRLASEQGVVEPTGGSSAIFDPWWSRPVGQWPSSINDPRRPSPDLGLPTIRTGKVHILLVPTQEGAAVPAYLGYGGWGVCPPPEWHVAALRSWHERYGAELVSLDFNSLSLRVPRRPTDKDGALALASEQYLYAPLFEFNGPRTLASLAARLLVDGWWSFEWT